MQRLRRCSGVSPGECECCSEDQGEADAVDQVESDIHGHRLGLEAFGEGRALQRQHDEPAHEERRDAEDEPAGQTPHAGVRRGSTSA